MRKTNLFLTTVALAAGPSFAQQQQNAGLGGVYAKVDTVALVTDVLQLGVESINGRIYVSSAGAFSAAGGLRNIHEIDPFAAGGPVLVNTVAQDTIHSTVAWGVRDMATDGTVLIGGSGAGFTVWDPATGLPAPTVMAANGPQAVPALVTGPGLAAVGTYRAMAYDAAGNGGNGSIFTASFGSDFYEVDLAGNVLNVFPNANAVAWSAYGCALDPRTGNLLVNATPVNGDIGEYVIDRTALTLTDTLRGPIAFDQGVQGGLSMFDFGGNQFADSPWPCDTAYVWLSQDAQDAVYVAALHRRSDVLGYDEPKLQTGVNSAVDSMFSKPFGAGDTITIAHCDPSNSLTGWPTYTMFNFGGVASNTDGLTTVAGSVIVELRANNLVSVPNTDPTRAIVDHALNGAGGTAGIDLSFVVPTPNPIPVGLLMRVQGLYINAVPGDGPFGTTNEAVFVSQ